MGKPCRVRRRWPLPYPWSIGPDEYHETVDDNAYTNCLAQWDLEIAEEAARFVAERWPEQWRALSRRLGLEPEEPCRWLRVAGDLYTGFDEQTGLFEQFQGYFGLEEIDLATFAPRTAPMDVLLGRERIQRSKIIKQADVVMLLPPALGPPCPRRSERRILTITSHAVGMEAR